MDEIVQVARGDDIPRPMEGMYLRDALKRLALVSAIATSLRFDLEPLTEDDIAHGAEPVTADQIADSLDSISSIITSFALEELRATPDEWTKANDRIA